MALINWEIPCFSKEEGERRHKAIKEMMDIRGIDCLIIVGHEGCYKARAANLRYVSNYVMWMGDEYVVFPLEGQPLLLVWASAHENWAKRVSWIPVKVSGFYSRSKESYLMGIVNRIKELGLERGRIGIVDTDTMPAVVYCELIKRLPNANFIDAGDLITEVREVKSEAELDFMRKSAECADKGFLAMRETAAEGVMDSAVWAACESAMVRNGAEPPSFTLYASGPWPNIGINFPHGPTMRVLKKGDMVMNEITPSYGGYWVQLCRPICLGNPPEDFKKTLNVHLEMYEVTRRELRPGKVFGEINAKMRQMAEEYGYDPANALSLQHIGLDIVERISERTVLKPGMVIVNHPWTEYPPGKTEYGGHVIGDTYIVTEKEPEPLSKIPLELTVI
jgi:Xaa-Pro aminopeptidase